MIKYPAVQLWWLAQELARLEKDLRFAGEPAPQFSKAWAATVNALMAVTEGHCKTLGLEEAATLPVYRLKADVQRFELTERCTMDWPQEISNLCKGIEVELSKRGFAYIPKEKVKFFDREQIFGEPVFNAFPSARFDLKEAGNCLACGMNTAAGFHLMRAIEIGMWELAKDRQVPLGAKLEFSEWGVIIRNLEQAAEAIQQWPNSLAKEEAHQFYNRSLVELRAFNDGWRRHLAHVRRSQIPLSDDEAVALTGHVDRFLSTLATKISEDNYTPLVWK